MRRWGTQFVGVVVAVLLQAPVASAQGASADPDSPSGVEYQLPLERAREKGAGSDPGGPGARKGGGDGAAPLFGVGIQRRPGGGEDRTGGAGGQQGTSSSSPSSGGSKPGAPATEGGGGGSSPASGGGESPSTDADGEAVEPTRLASQAGGGDSSLLQTGGIVLAVLLVGGAMGAGLRKTFRGSEG